MNYSDEEVDAAADAEVLIPILAAIDACFVYEYWHKTFGNIDDESPFYVYGQYEALSDAARLFSLLSLRKVDEFFYDGGKQREDDVRYSDFGLKGTLGRSLLSKAMRSKINKCVAHPRTKGEGYIEDIEEMQAALEAAKPKLDALKAELSEFLMS